MKNTAHRIAIIGAPLDLGQGRRGVDMGPSAVRVAGSEQTPGGAGLRSRRSGQRRRRAGREPAGRGPSEAKYLAADCGYPASGSGDWSTKALTEGRVPLVLGGDHSIAAGTVAGVSRFFRNRNAKDRPDLDRRACRHEHARVQPQRQRAWHAAGLLCRAGPGRADANVRLRAQGRPGERGAGRHPRCG